MDGITILGGAFALLFRALVAQPFTIPASSMAPTLEVGDYVWATKFSYGYSNFSLPYGQAWPAFTYARTGPRRGDVIVFRPAEQPSTDYVKRVIGLPGDTVQVKEGIVWLNGAALARKPAGTHDAQAGMNEEETMQRFVETLPDGRSYEVIEMAVMSMGDNTGIFTVPAGHYFVMGDNRDNSDDSRFSLGFVPEANIYAKVVVAITWPNGQFTRRDVK